MGERQVAKIFDNKVVKIDEPLLIAIEAEKTRRAREIGEHSGLFHVPRVLGYDPAAGRLELELLTNIRPLHLMLPRVNDWKDLVGRIGRSLALIHDELRLPPELSLPLPEVWQLAGTEMVVLHGDFGIFNIQIDERNGQLVILDWSISPLLGMNGTVGLREFDIAWFMRSLFFVRRRCRLLSKRAAYEIHEFLENYFSQSHYSPEPNVFLRYLSYISSHFLKLWMGTTTATSPVRWGGHVLLELRCERYIHSKSLRRKCETILKT